MAADAEEVRLVTVSAVDASANELAKVLDLAGRLAEGSPIAGLLRSLVASLGNGEDAALIAIMPDDVAAEMGQPNAWCVECGAFHRVLAEACGDQA